MATSFVVANKARRSSSAPCTCACTTTFNPFMLGALLRRIKNSHKVVERWKAGMHVKPQLPASCPDPPSVPLSFSSSAPPTMWLFQIIIVLFVPSQSWRLVASTSRDGSLSASLLYNERAWQTHDIQIQIRPRHSFITKASVFLAGELHWPRYREVILPEKHWTLDPRWTSTRWPSK